MAIDRLKRRSEFLRVRGGGRASMSAFVIEGKARPGPQPAPDAVDPAVAVARFGFTVTKKLGNAVVRNRIRRRLRAAVAALAPGRAQVGFDYVIIARSPALDRPFTTLQGDLDAALRRVHEDRPKQDRPNRPGRK